MGLVQLAEFANSAKATKWLLRGLLPTGSLAALLGETNSGKSAAAIALAMSIAARCTTYCGLQIGVHGASFYILAEGQDGMKPRVRIYAENVLQLAGDELTRVPLFFLPAPVALSVEGQAATLADMMTRTLGAWADALGIDAPPVRLVVIDTLARNLGGDANESDNADMSAVMNNCGQLQALLGDEASDDRPTILLVAHPGHGAKGRIRGAYAVQAACDVILNLEVAQNIARRVDDDGADLLGEPIAVGLPRYLSVSKARDGGQPAPLVLQLVQESPAWLRGEDGESNSTVYLAKHSEFGGFERAAPVTAKVTDAQVLKVIRDHGAASSVAAMARDLGISKASLQDRLKTLTKRGSVKQREDGHYAVTPKGQAQCR